MKKTVAVLGLGYVGFPLAELLVKKGYNVIGLELTAEKALAAEKRMQSKRFRGTDDVAAIKSADVVVVCVPTPVKKGYLPDYRPLEIACRSIAQNIKRGRLVIIESTINPGTCEEVVLPIFDERKLRAGKDFFLAHCPERIDPGSTKWTIETIPRNVGGIDKKSGSMAAAFYRTFLKGKVLELSSIKAAEATKIVENTFRDINIAYVNELAMSFDTLGIDLSEVIAGASSKPFAFMPHFPGIGVGGHCIAVDPYYLIDRAGRQGFDHKFLKLARAINNGMPAYAVKLLGKELTALGRTLSGTSVGVLGLAYKANIDDIRESPAIETVAILKKKKARVHTFDPHVPSQSTESSLKRFLEKCDAVILATAHKEFRTLTAADFKKCGVRVVIDGRNIFNKADFLRTGVRYKGIGR